MAATEDDLMGPSQPKAMKPGKGFRVQLNFVPCSHVLSPTPSYCYLFHFDKGSRDMSALLGKHFRGHSVFLLLRTLMTLFWCAVSSVPPGFVISRRHLNCKLLRIMKLVGSLSSLFFRFSYNSVLMFHEFFD